MTRFNKANKYNAHKVYSELCGRTFDSRAEAQRGEELELMVLAGEISDLQYQVPFLLCQKPNIKLRLDFSYKKDGKIIYADTKGVLTREARVKLAWLKEKFGIDVLLTP